MLYVYVEAPFAVFRTFTAGWFRPTATFMTPSAAYGLLLNVACVESRLREGETYDNLKHDGKTPASYTRPGLPACRIALGVPAPSGPAVDESDLFPRLQSCFQQLHNYPVGQSGKARAEECRGSKYNIAPVRREFLSDLRVVIAVEGNADFENRIQRGALGEFNQQRYGIPFVGDNAFLPDRFETLDLSSPIIQDVRWYERLGAETRKSQPRATRMTCRIDRADLSKTTSELFGPAKEFSSIHDPPPENAWTRFDA